MRNSHVQRRRLDMQEYGDADPATGTPGGDPVAVAGGVEPVEPVEIPEVCPPGEEASVELDIQASVTEDAVQGAEAEEVVIAQEGLRHIHSQIAELIAKGQCTPATEALIASNIDMVLGKLQMSTVGIASESLAHETDIVERHRLMMEAVSMEGEAVQQLAQTYVVGVKHGLNAVGDFFRSTKGRIGKYRTKLQETRKEYDEVKSKLKGEVTVSSSELWYHFSNDHGPISGNRLMPALKQDADMSTFVLTVYPKRALEAATKALAVLKAADLKTPEGAAKAAAQLERLPSAVEMFDKKFIGPTYLSVKKLEINEGKARKPISIGGKTFTRLAELAGRSYVEETGSFAHNAAKVSLYTPVGAITNAVKSGKKFLVEANDIGQILDIGDLYLKNIDTYMAMEAEFKKVADAADNVITGSLSGSAYEGASKEGAQVAMAAEQYLTSLLLTAFQSPAKAELARSLKGAKYNMYLANRAIWNGK